ncbi:MAG TPA: DinB family protein [Candidatus Methylomirabilis sp.]|nr:DinB family protein [Candidatus Methylomirabilis sp.]
MGLFQHPASVVREARRELARLPVTLQALVGDLDARTARIRPAPAEWSPVEVLCHLRDEETDDFGARLRVLLDGGAEFAPIHPERWVEERRYRESEPLEVLERLRQLRAASLELLASTPPDRLLAAAPHKRLGSLSGLDLLVGWVAHDQLHLSQLSATLARLWADRWAPLKAGYAGPIPYSAGPPR